MDYLSFHPASCTFCMRDTKTFETTRQVSYDEARNMIISNDFNSAEVGLDENGDDVEELYWTPKDYKPFK